MVSIVYITHCDQLELLIITSMFASLMQGWFETFCFGSFNVLQMINNWSQEDVLDVKDDGNFEDFKLYESLSLRFGFRTGMEEELWPEVLQLSLFSWASVTSQ